MALRSVGWLSTDVSGQPIGPILKGQLSFLLGQFTLEDQTDSLSRNVDA